MSTTDETRGIRHAILRALADSAEGLTRSEIALAIQAESDEVRKVNGVISGLMNANPKLAISIGSTVRLTEAGRKSLGPVAPVAAPLPPAPAPSNATATVGVNTAAAEAAASAAELGEALRAIRVIEAAFPGPTGGLSPAAVADRVIDHISIAATVARESAIVTTERDEARRRATLCDDALAEAAGLTGRLNLANAEIARLRAELDDVRRGGVRWSANEEGRRLIRRAFVEEIVGEVTCRDDGVTWFGGPAHGAIELDAPTDEEFDRAVNLAQDLVEIAAGVRRRGEMVGGGE